jgi:hypothetical protein
LLDRYQKEGPVLAWEEEVRSKISEIRGHNDIHFLGMVTEQTRSLMRCIINAFNLLQALNQRSADQVQARGPKVEAQVEELISACGHNPTNEYNAALQEWSVRAFQFPLQFPFSF